ncbi:MAG: UDP-N-acetylmuramoyl-tripeptide--D-alanyl-D-alanine ligase [Maricaulaceae bacterium]
MGEALWTAEMVVAATGGRPVGPDWTATGVSIDTRTLEPGDLFAPLIDRRDGHDFIEAAFEAGAAATLSMRPLAPGVPGVIVSDTFAALRDLGRVGAGRAAFRCAITGSVGKTSVTAMTARIFKALGRAHAPDRSFNNHIGVPLTLARTPGVTERLVAEIGMNAPGEIAPLSKLTRPHVGLITAIGAAHLEGVGSMAGIVEEKTSLFAGLERGGVAVIPADGPYADAVRTRAGRFSIDRFVSFGTQADADVRVLRTQTEGESLRSEIEVFGVRVGFRIGALGAHWAVNGAAALALAVLSGLDAQTAAQALSGYAPGAGRGAAVALRLEAGEATLLDDAYNANPTSVRAALATLGARAPGPGGRRIAVLGDMLELGAEAERLHADLATPIREAALDQVWCAGPLMGHLYAALAPQLRVKLDASSEAAAESLAASLRPGDVVLVKGSNASGVGRLADALKARFRT